QVAVAIRPNLRPYSKRRVTGIRLARRCLTVCDSGASPKEVKSMKRRITGVILISLGLGLFWQALPEGLDCHTRCQQSYYQCTDLAHKAINPIRSLKYATTHITGVWGIALIDK